MMKSEQEMEIVGNPKSVKIEEIKGIVFESKYDQKESTQARQSKDKNHICKVCGKECKTLTRLKNHEIIHTGEKPFEREVCGKRFNQKFNLKTHGRIHANKTPKFKSSLCKICGKKSKTYQIHEIHERIHFIQKKNLSNEKQFECKTCGTSFKLKKHLKKHERIHTNENPFTCKLCGKDFNRSAYLRTHEKIHAYDKKYKCETCVKYFRTNEQLRSHHRIHNGLKRYQCEICKKDFRDLSIQIKFS